MAKPVAPISKVSKPNQSNKVQLLCGCTMTQMSTPGLLFITLRSSMSTTSLFVDDGNFAKFTTAS